MKVILLLVITVIISGSLFSQGKGGLGPDELKLYRELNNKEVRLEEYKDNDEALNLKLKQLDIINKSRRKNRVLPVSLDILASRVANRMCREAAENGYVSHWNLAGEKPYQRYAFAGGYDHVSENAFGEWTSGFYNTSGSDISGMMESGHSSFMSERAPNDGHKKNIIDKAHNFVGIGYYITEKQFRYYEEFIDRYFEFENIPSQLNVNEAGSITIRTNGTIFPYYLIIYREKFPVPLSTAQLKKTGSYQDYSSEEYLSMPAWEIGKYKSGSTYKIPIKFNKEGLYYIHIYVDKKEIKSPSALDTKGKTEGCGIVIRVEK
jgi:uncharacterized protein YkwD